MRKKILTFLLMICLVVPCAFLLVGCKDDDSSSGGGGGGGNPPAGATGSLEINLNTESDEDEGVWLLSADATECFGNYDVVEDGNYSIWLADFYNKDTLVIKYDNEPVNITPCETPGYENKTFGLNPRKIAIF